VPPVLMDSIAKQTKPTLGALEVLLTKCSVPVDRPAIVVLMFLATHLAQHLANLEVQMLLNYSAKIEFFSLGIRDFSVMTAEVSITA